VAIAIIFVLVVIVLVGIDITVHVTRRAPHPDPLDDHKIIVDLTKRK